MNSLENQQNLNKSYSSSEEEAFDYSWCLRTTMIFSYVLDAAIQLGLFDIIAKAGEGAHISSIEIALQIPNATNPQAASLVDRMLRLFACYNLVTCISRNINMDEDSGYKVERLYGLALPGKAFVRNENGGSLATSPSNEADMEAWLHLKDMVLEGGNLFERVSGMPIHEYMSLHPEMTKAFETSMTNLSKITMKKVLEIYQGFQGITTLVDVGGGYGTTLNMILSKYP